MPSISNGAGPAKGRSSRVKLLPLDPWLACGVLPSPHTSYDLHYQERRPEFCLLPTLQRQCSGSIRNSQDVPRGSNQPDVSLSFPPRAWHRWLMCPLKLLETRLRHNEIPRLILALNLSAKPPYWPIPRRRSGGRIWCSPA